MRGNQVKKYPLRENAADELRAFSERPLRDISPDAIAEGELSGEDLRTHADTLRQQAAIAQEAGYPQLAANLRRAAELTGVPNDELLKVYELLRPERATFDELTRLADYLEASGVYRERGLLRRDGCNFIRDLPLPPAAGGVYRERGLLRR